MVSMGRLRRAWGELTRKGAATRTQEWRTLSEWLGIDPDTADDERSEATYFACLKVLSESMAKMPCKLMSRTDAHGVRAEREHPLYGVVESRPNRFMGAVTFWSAIEQNRNQFGNAFALITGSGGARRLWVLPSSDVQIWYDNARRIDEVADVWYMWSTGAGVVPLRSSEVLHFRTSNTLDGITGVSVADQLRGTISGNVKGQRMVDRLYDSDMSSKAVVQLTGDLSEANAKKFMKGLERYMSGALREEGIEHLIPLPVGATLTPLSMKLADSQFVDLRKYTAVQIASAFGIKPYQIGDYGKESYSSQSAQQLSFYVDTLLYIVRQYEQELTYKLLTDEERARGLFFKYNVASMLRADQATQIQTLSTGVSNFIYTPNEARALLDLESKPGGDELLGNGAAIPVGMAGAQYARDAREGGESDE